MVNRLLVPLLCAAAVAFACGPRPHAATESATATPATPTPARRSPNEPLLASALDVSIRDGVTLALHVTNNDRKHVELLFPSGQTHDFAILDSTGKEIWRWSAGRLFTQALQNKVLESHESATFAERWDAGARHGTFTAVATLASSSHPLETRVEFSLP
jgi:hypothetical protein